ncbi:MAG: hypothetical protein ACREJG_04785, partial [Candidatus Rokuibacteriota bacterium]
MGILLLISLAWGGLMPRAAHAAAGEAALPGWVGRLGDGLGAMIGVWINDELVFGVRWITLGVSVIVLALVGVADVILRLLVRRKLRRDETQSQDATEGERETLYWFHRGLAASVPPLALLLWVYGLYLAASVLLIEVRFRDEAQLVLRALAWFKSVGILAGLFWLLYRVSGVIEARLGSLSARSASIWDQILVPLAGRTVRLT